MFSILQAFFDRDSFIACSVAGSSRFLYCPSYARLYNLRLHPWFHVHSKDISTQEASFKQ
jgi:hypothetical protein